MPSRPTTRPGVVATIVRAAGAANAVAGGGRSPMSVIRPRNLGLRDRRADPRAGAAPRVQVPAKAEYARRAGPWWRGRRRWPGKVQRGGDLPGDRDAQAGHLSPPVRGVAQQPDAA